MHNITAIILAKNEEEMLPDCLKSLSFCDEIIVIDNGSTDKTVQIAQSYHAKVIDFASDDFSSLRNQGLKLAKGNWVLYIDADEQVSPSLSREIILKSHQDSTVSAYKIKRQNFYLGNHLWPQIEQIERLFKKNTLQGWVGKLHESAQVEGEIGLLHNYLLHYTHRDLTSMVKKTLEWSKIEAELRYEANHPKMSYWRFPRVMALGFFNSYIRQQGYKAGTVGLIESIYQAFSMFITYARLWELQQQK